MGQYRDHRSHDTESSVSTPSGITLQQFRDALAVAQHGSLNAAARSTGQTQPGLSRSLQRLEQDLGAPLFERHARGVRPTEYGRRFLVHARRTVAEAQRARDTVAQMVGQQRGRVEYGVSAAAAILLAPPAIARFRRAHPEVELASRSGLYHSLAPGLRDGQLDFVVCPVPQGVADPQFASRRLMRSQMVMVARKGHPRAHARRLETLRDASFVVAAPRGLPGAGIYELMERHGLGTPRIELRTDGLIDTIGMVAASDCLALMPSALLRSGLLRERLVVLPVSDELPAYDVAAFHRAAVPLAPAADALLTEIEREAAYLGSGR
jgi:DNA-binding transcriptional LysR family regulator